MPENYTGTSQMPVHPVEPLRLTILYEEDEGQVVARIKEVPAAISHGDTRDEARDSVLDALRELAASYLEDGEASAPAADTEALAVFADTA
jgi:predicted RNase H-like HicB family nuclease